MVKRRQPIIISINVKMPDKNMTKTDIKPNTNRELENLRKLIRAETELDMDAIRKAQTDLIKGWDKSPK